MNRHLYPTDWQRIATDIKAACGYVCTLCGLQCRRPGEMYLGWAYESHIAHITQDYAAPVVQVACLCAACHLRHDAPLAWVARRRAERWRMRAAGQLELLPARG